MFHFISVHNLKIVRNILMQMQLFQVLVSLISHIFQLFVDILKINPL